MSINHSELLLNEIDRLQNDSFCACCTCLFFIANWPKRLNDVWHKAVMRGLGIRLFQDSTLQVARVAPASSEDVLKTVLIVALDLHWQRTIRVFSYGKRC